LRSLKKVRQVFCLITRDNLAAKCYKQIKFDEFWPKFEKNEGMASIFAIPSPDFKNYFCNPGLFYEIPP